MTTEVDGAVEAVTVRPGDTLLLRFSYRMSDDEIDQMVERFKEFRERTGVQVCVIDGCDQMIGVVRGEDR